MRITQWGEYGIHFTAFLARREREGSTMTGASEIANSQGVELQYAQQILHRLRKGGIIDSIRGPSGGYRLCRPATEISVRDVLLATEGETFAVICESKPIDEHRCVPSTNCGLRGLWFELKEHVDAFLGKYSIEELSKLPGYTFAATSPFASQQGPVKIGTNGGLPK